MAEIERADLQQTQAAGTFGVAYAGGAISYSHNAEVGSPPKDLTLDRVRSSERASPKDSDGSQGSIGRRHTLKNRERDGARDVQGPRDSPTGRERAAAPMSTSPNSQPRGRNRSPDSGDHYSTPMASPGEHTATYASYEREYYPAPTQAHARVPTPPAARRSSNATAPESGSLRGTPPAISKLAAQTPPVQAAKARTPDRSLPVQEEVEDDVNVGASKGARDRRRPSPTPSSDLHPEGNDIRYTTREERHEDGRASRAEHRDDDDITLNEHDEDDHAQHKDNSVPSESEGYTPRSPTADLPNQYGGDMHYTSNMDFQQTIRAKTRNGITDQLGLRGLEQTFETLKEQPPAPQPLPTHQEQAARQARPPAYGSEIQHFFDESAYLQAYLQSPRPNAPVPPTPHSATAAPSPSPLISGMHSVGPSPAPPVGSPYPYPFTHIRRAGGYNASQQSSTYDPNHPAAIQEQLARQMQIYAMNNAAILSDSTLSPSSTPFPGPGYNPWAFLPTTRHMRGGLDASMSIRSSPSHEPVELSPPRVTRGKSLKHQGRSGNLRAQPAAAKQRKPPPRVESTQPRETSPESTSGEETAGEEKIEEQFVPDEVQWVNGVLRDDTGEWIDEDDDEGDEDDLLELEFHPSYIGNPEKRRRKWETRWDDLVQAFQALDRQTDTTLVLLASPPHSTKLHALTSRSIRRDPSLRHSPAMSSIRTSFTHVASQRRASRSQMVSLADRLSLHSGASADGSDVSSSSREEDLKRALEAALGSLGALGNIYEQREARWREEMRRLTDERERVELLLRQTLGSRLPNGNGVGHAM